MNKNDKTKLYFGLENLRAVNLSLTEIRPITILVGRNNLGKSSVLRTFPLIKQSIDNPTIEPINWKGGIVDFGNFETTVKEGKIKNGITFRFAVENFPIQNTTLLSSKKAIGIEATDKIAVNGKIIFDVQIVQHKNHIIRRITGIELPSHKVNFKVVSNCEKESEKIILNGNELPKTFKKYLFGFPSEHIFSEIVPHYLNEFKDTIIPNASDFEAQFVINVEKKLKSKFGNQATEKELRAESLNILTHPCLDDSSLQELEKNACSANFRKYYEELRQSSKKFNKQIAEFNSYCGLFSAINAFNQICKFFDVLLSRSTYFKPTRSINDRFIRNENLRSDQVFPDGRNLPNFFESIKPKGLKDFSNWINNYFDFGISISNGGDHTSLMVETNGKKRNIADSGFGISEVLPVLAQIWWTTYQKEKLPSVYSALYSKSLSRQFKQLETYSLISIEQPESHLHPKRQEILADIFVDSLATTKSNKDKTRITPIYLIETHSSSILNRLGELVEQKKIAPDQIQILVFSATNDDAADSIDIQESYFDENGYLHNWPYKFLR